MQTLNGPRFPRLLKLAMRDLRGDPRSALLLFVVSTIGLTALSSVGSVSEALKRSLENQSQQLLGADAVVIARETPSPELKAKLGAPEGEPAREVSFRSMAQFPDIDLSRLVQVRAIEPKFPFYGDFDTEPPKIKQSLDNGFNALVDDSLMAQLGLDAGARLILGRQEFRITGRVKKVPGESIIRALVAPRVYVPLKAVENSALLSFGSVASYRWYFKTPAEKPLDRSAIKSELEQNRLELETAEDRLRSVGETLSAIDPYLKLFALVAFALGGLGMGSALQVFLRKKQQSGAVLRALGARRNEVLLVIIFQIALVVFGSLVLSLALSTLVIRGLSRTLQSFAPLPFGAGLAPEVAAVTFGVLISLIFLLGAATVLKLSSVSPLAALSSFGDRQLAEARGFKTHLTLYAAGAGLLTLALWLYMGQELWGLVLGLGCLAIFLVLVGLAQVLIAALELFHRAHLPFSVRQGLLNMRRPFNQTTSIVVCLGSVLLVFLTIAYLERSFAREFSSAKQAGRPNAVLIDVQTDQLAGIHEIVENQRIALVEEAPVVSMRLASIKGVSAGSLINNPLYERWTLVREYRSTYRQELTDSETLLAGTFSTAASNSGSPVPVSIEQGLAAKLKIGLNDKLVFDVQGLPLEAVITSLRKVDWKRVKPNFFFVFPAGVLEDAPKFFLLALRTQTPEQLAALQRELGRGYRNVSLVDLSLVTKTLDSVVSNVSAIVKLMSAFALLASITVLAGAVLSTRGERARELALLKTLGATRTQARTVVFLEYLSLAIASSLFGILLALPSAWALAHYLFKIGFAPGLLPTLCGPLIIIVLTLTLTGSMTKAVYERSALEALRRE